MMKKKIKLLLFLLFIILLIYNPLSTRLFTIVIAWTQNIDSTIFYKQIKAESNFNPVAFSHQKAFGLGQLKIKTAEYIFPQFQIWMLFFPPTNLLIAAKYDKYLLKKFNNNWSLSLAAYNWGETNVRKKTKNIKINPKKNYSYLFINIKETSSYLSKIIK